MNVFEFVLLIVLIVTIGRLVERRSSGRRCRKNAPDSGGVEGEDMGARFASLEERIRVLEHIVTDEGYDLRKKFRDLED